MKTMSEIYAGYARNKNEVARIKRLIERHKKTLRRLNDNGGWMNLMVKPLASAISERLGGIPWEIYGPFGLSAETTIYLFPSGGDDICHDETYSITVYPSHCTEEFTLDYDTGARTNTYAPGTVGALNGFNKVKAPLPDEIDNVLKLLEHCDARH